jgi:hypothetical protein
MTKNKTEDWAAIAMSKYKHAAEFLGKTATNIGDPFGAYALAITLLDLAAALPDGEAEKLMAAAIRLQDDDGVDPRAVLEAVEHGAVLRCPEHSEDLS